MTTSVKFLHMEKSEALETQSLEKLGNCFNKYGLTPTEATITYNAEQSEIQAHCKVRTPELTIDISEQGSDAYYMLNTMIDRLSKKVSRTIEKKHGHKGRKTIRDLELEETDEEETDEEE